MSQFPHLSKDADRSAKEMHGDTALLVAATKGHLGYAAGSDSVSVTVFLPQGDQFAGIEWYSCVTIH